MWRRAGGQVVMDVGGGRGGWGVGGWGGVVVVGGGGWYASAGWRGAGAKVS